MKHFLNILLLILPLLSSAQLQDDFSDGNFTTDPAWSGTTATFTVNTAKQLQTSGTAAATSYLSTPHNPGVPGNKEWRVYAKLGFAGSSSNFARIYLAADHADLSVHPNGYYLQMGESGTTDAVRLCRMQSGVSTQICTGTIGAISSSANTGIRVVRDVSGNWSLYVDYGGGTNYVWQSSGTDTSPLAGTHFGFLCTYTSSNASKFFFDNVYAGNEVLDTQPPQLLSATAINALSVDLVFSEAIQQASGETIANYVIAPSNAVVSAIREATNPAQIHLTLAYPLVNGVQNTVTVSNVSDFSGNTSVQTGTFLLLMPDIPVAGDVIINEFMCDPTPPLGLPELEYVEIYNKSDKVFQLTGWKLGDNATYGTISGGWLLPWEHKILCATSSVTYFPTAAGVASFPSLNNSGDDIVLKDNSGQTLDKLTYTDAWYRDDHKKAGGYSLELINPEDPCSDFSNWRASDHENGGTPGTRNSVYDISPDTEAPKMIDATAAEPNLLTIRFSEGLEQQSLEQAVFQSVPALTVLEMISGNTFSSEATYRFAEELSRSEIYHFTLTGIADCWQNVAELSGKFVLPDSVAAGDLVINEILFNPRTGGYDFVELRNNSAGKMIDLYGLSLANISKGEIANIRKIPAHFILGPGEYAALTQDPLIQLQTYPAAIPGRFIQMSLPAMNNDSGTVILLKDLTTLDRVSYREKWHFRLLDDFDGKSLEKIDPAGSSGDKHNWHTAAEPVGFATPGGQNSQYSAAQESGKFFLTSDTFSPDNDGFEDVLRINYRMNSPGMVASVTIFDDRGRHIRSLVQSELLGIDGSLSWDGLTDGQQKAGIGTYVLIFEAFNALNGDIFAQQKAFVLAGKL